jgi:hypothetical protein
VEIESSIAWTSERGGRLSKIAAAAVALSMEACCWFSSTVLAALIGSGLAAAATLFASVIHACTRAREAPIATKRLVMAALEDLRASSVWIDSVTALFSAKILTQTSTFVIVRSFDGASRRIGVRNCAATHSRTHQSAASAIWLAVMIEALR